MRRVWLALVLCACSAEPQQPGLPAHSDFALGASRAELLLRYGEPAREATLTKRDEHIWGPIETFWYGLPMGATVELWAYASTSPSAPGSCETELYFVDGSDQVDGIGLHLEGVVYESQ